MDQKKLEQVRKDTEEVQEMLGVDKDNYYRSEYLVIKMKGDTLEAMDNEVKILMEDRCTRKEAERFLKRGTVIFDSFDEFADSLKESGIYNGESYEQAVNGQLEGISVVEYQGKEYIISYVY